MEEFRLGGVQSGLTVRCHMVSLIADFSLRQRGTPKETVERRKTQTQNWGKSFDSFDVVTKSFQIEPKGTIINFMVSGDWGTG